ncbi:unnamed protein product, partial [Phaeothamnion confervicola]
QGRRLAWWSSQAELENGHAAERQLLLHGHAGVTSPSPLELREVAGAGAAVEVGAGTPHLVCVFGRSPEGRPQRWSFLTRSAADGRALSATVSGAVDAKRD